MINKKGKRKYKKEGFSGKKNPFFKVSFHFHDN